LGNSTPRRPASISREQRIGKKSVTPLFGRSTCSFTAVNSPPANSTLLARCCHVRRTHASDPQLHS
jgi:hypothetical protein